MSNTPGPWRVFENANHFLVGIGELNGDGITDCGFGIWRGTSEEARANANLIAAAPDMLAALKRGAQVDLPTFLEWIADRFVHVYGESEDIDFVLSCRDRAKWIRAAIAKAEGSSP